MKKLFTSIVLLMLTLCVNAQDETRKVWDFRNGFSDETITNFMGDASWTKEGKYDAETGIGFFESQARTAGQVTLTVNGAEWIVPELKGLKFGATSAQHLNIVIGEKNLGPHVWLNGKKSEDYVQIETPIPAGEKVYVIYSSHKNSEARGFSVSGDFKDEKGKQKWTVSTREGIEEIPDKYLDTVCVINTGAEAAKLKMNTTNGMHFHLIAIGEMPKPVDKAVKMAFIYDSKHEKQELSKSICEAIAQNIGQRIEGAEVQEFDVDNTTLTRELLEYYSVVMIGHIGADRTEALAAIKSTIAYTPIINLTNDNYEAWGYGTPVATEQTTVKIGENYAESALWTKDGESLLNQDGTFTLLEDGMGTIVASELGEYFAKDEIVATADDKPVIHIHNANRNAYMLISAMSGESFLNTDKGMEMLYNAIQMIANTKTEVTKATKPVVSETYSHLSTSAKLTCPTKDAVVYYTLDGTEPTTESTIFTDPLTFTEKTTVKAFATADGYNPSDVTTYEISIHSLAQTPTITSEVKNDSTFVTITAVEEGATIYYNLTKSKNVKASQLYTKPFYMPFTATLYAFVAEQGELLQSELAEQLVNVGDNKPVRTKVALKFEGKSFDTAPFASRGVTSKTEKGYPYYNENEAGEEKEVDGDLIIVYPPTGITYFPMDKWQATTWGQGMTKLSANPNHNVGEVTDYNPLTVFDDFESQNEITSNPMQFSGSTNSSPDSCYAELYSLEKVAGPFDVVVYAAGKDTLGHIDICADTLTTKWSTIGYMPSHKEDFMDGSKNANGRVWSKYIASYEGNDEVLVRIKSAGRLCNIFTVLIKVEDKEDAIRETAAEKSLSTIPAGIYNINGVRQNSLQRGLNIVRYGDGKIRKVLMK